MVEVETKPSAGQALVGSRDNCNSRPSRLTHMWYTDIHSGRTPTCKLENIFKKGTKEKREKEKREEKRKEKKRRKKRKEKSSIVGRRLGGAGCPHSTGSLGGAVQASGYWYFLSCTGKATSRAMRTVELEVD